MSWAALEKMTVPWAQEQEDDSQFTTKPPAKTPGGYHFTSTVQDMANGDVVQTKILDMPITLPLKDVIGISTDLQKWFAGLTKIWCEYATKTINTKPRN